MKYNRVCYNTTEYSKTVPTQNIGCFWILEDKWNLDQGWPNCCQGPKSVRQDIFRRLWNFFEKYICLTVLRILQHLIENYTILGVGIAITFDMVLSNYVVVSIGLSWWACLKRRHVYVAEWLSGRN